MSAIRSARRPCAVTSLLGSFSSLSTLLTVRSLLRDFLDARYVEVDAEKQIYTMAVISVNSTILPPNINKRIIRRVARSIAFVNPSDN
jgi:hypothetical protein